MYSKYGSQISVYADLSNEQIINDMIDTLIDDIIH